VGIIVVSPAGPIDSRNSFVATNNAVFIVDNAKGQIVMCFPESKDNQTIVSCTPPTKLSQ
jgi:hypothetical protein